MVKTAILVDGGFFVKRSLKIFGQIPPEELPNKLFLHCLKHLWAHNHHPKDSDAERDELYRIFYYDCPPLNKKLLHPITKQTIDFGNSTKAKWRKKLFEELTHHRKVALRLGRMDEVNTNWVINPKLTSKIINGRIAINELEENDVILINKQKGVDMRIGIDIASLAYKHLVDRIVLIAGDSDFVPASKLARREGIDFILDPMWAPIKPDLFEHIDGLKSVFPDPNKACQSEQEESESKDLQSKFIDNFSE